MKSVSTSELCAWIDAVLNTSSFSDYCPNGLQVEGKPIVRHIVAGVTASQALIEHAVAQGADTLLVHHGWFWKGEDVRVRGIRRTRLKQLLEHDINLLAYHLPLDAHPLLGNNAQLARILGLVPEYTTGKDQTITTAARPITTGPNGLVWLGTMPGLCALGQIAQRVHECLGRMPLTIGAPDLEVKRIAWCTGAAQNMLTDAIEAGVQCFITGEISEPTVHLARESGVGFISAGHHATERYGVQALGHAISEKFGVQVDFIDLENPV